MNEYVASFRIPSSVKERIEAQLQTHPVSNCDTVNQYLRCLSIEVFCSISGCQPPPLPRPIRLHKVQVAAVQSWEERYAAAVKINGEIGDFDAAYAKFLRGIQGK